MAPIKKKTNNIASVVNQGPVGSGVSAQPLPTLEDFEKISRDIKGELTDLQSKMGVYKQELNDYKIKMIEIVAIFVALFTFISVDIQIFKSSNLYILGAIGFILVTLGSLVFFIGTLNHTLNYQSSKECESDQNTKSNSLKHFIIYSLILITIGVICIICEYKNVIQKLNETFFTKVEINNLVTSVQETASSSQVELVNFKKCIKIKGAVACSK